MSPPGQPQDSTYSSLEFYDVIGYNLPKIEKAWGFWHRTAPCRDLRVICCVNSNEIELPWKPYAEKMEWSDRKYSFPTVRAASHISFEIRAKSSRVRTVLQSEAVTIESLIQQGTKQTSIKIKLVSTSTTEIVKNAYLSLTLHATGISSGVVDQAKSSVLSRGKPVGRWSDLLDPLRKVLGIVGGLGEMEPHAKIALTCVQMACDALMKPLELSGKVHELMDLVGATLHLVIETEAGLGIESLTANQQRALPKLVHQTNECILFIRDFVNQSYLKIAAKAIAINYDAIIASYDYALRSLHVIFRDSQLLDIQVVVHRLQSMLQQSDHKLDAIRLGQLRIVEGVGRDPTKACLNGTRIDMLDTIRKWIHGSIDTRMFLLIGQAGAGKSAIAQSIANEYAKAGRLGSAFCFSKDSDPSSFFRTIARNLADLDPLYASTLGASMTSETEATQVPEIQMKQMLLQPFEGLSVLGPVVIVIDALDECSNPDPIVECLVHNIIAFPSNIRFLVTSRPSEAQDLVRQSWAKVFDLSHHPASDHDLLLYVKDQLKAYHDRLEPEDLGRIVSASEGLFQYASVVCKEMLSAFKYRSQESPEQVFTRLVKDSQAGLDGLYKGILSNLYGGDCDDRGGERDSEALIVFRQVMGWVLLAQHRLTHQTLVDFGLMLEPLGSKRPGYDAVSRALRPLGALLSGTHAPTDIVYPLHSSIGNFLQDPQRSGRFYIGPDSSHHDSITFVSLKLMLNGLRFNIAELETSYLLNDEVPNFDERVSSHVPRSLSYACIHWATHLRLSCCTEDQVDFMPEIQILFNQNFIFWLEVLGLEKSVPSAETACQYLLWWLKDSLALSSERIGQCLAFVRDYADVIAQCTPHLYLSGLALTPDILADSDLMFTGLPSVTPRYSSSSQHTYMTLHGHRSAVKSAAFSPDVRQIVSASDDKTVRIWDAQMGMQIGAPLSGHRASVFSAAFSPDGTQIVSASSDRTIRIWDVQNGQQVGVILPAFVHAAAFSYDGARVLCASHNMPVRIWDVQANTRAAVDSEEPFTLYRKQGISTPFGNVGWTARTRQEAVALLSKVDYRISPAAFSVDAMQVVSALEDNTIQVWDVQTGAQTGNALLGHEGKINSVMFSFDRRNIISSSDDKTIRIWDAQTGIQVSAPFSGHDGPINSAVYSPDGKYIVSASDDKTVRVWDVGHEGTSTSSLQLPTTPSHCVNSIAFSPDGEYIASASDDKAIRIWHVRTETQVGAALSGHEALVRSVAFSRDGKRIVSASHDMTVRVWDATNGQQVGAPMRGHTDSVRSAAFSPDGQRVVSASDDYTIRIWDTETGVQVGDSLEGHVGWVHCAVYSPDGKYILSASDDKTIRLWDAATGLSFGDPLVGHDDWVLSISFSPDGKRIVSGSADKTVRIWDTQTKQQIGEPLEGHTGYVLSVSFSPDGNYIASGSADTTIRMWDAVARVQVIGADLHDGHSNWVHSVVFSPDGKYLVSASEDMTVRVWLVQGCLDVKGFLAQNRAEIESYWPYSNENGWVKTVDNRCMLWIPAVYRERNFRFTSTYTWLLGRLNSHVSWKGSYHGTEWTKCYINYRRLHGA